MGEVEVEFRRDSWGKGNGLGEAWAWNGRGKRLEQDKSIGVWVFHGESFDLDLPHRRIYGFDGI